MASPASAAAEVAASSSWAVALWGCFTLVFTVLLLPVFPLDFRESVSALGLLVGRPGRH